MGFNSAYVALAVFTLLGLSVYEGDAIRCWECTSDRDYNCNDPFNYTHFPLVDCEHKRGSYGTYSQSYAVCRKTVTRVNGERIVERQCAFQRPGEPAGPCDLSSSSYSQVEHCSICYNDRCNSGFSVPPPALYTCLLATLICWLATKHF